MKRVLSAFCLAFSIPIVSLSFNNFEQNEKFGNVTRNDTLAMKPHITMNDSIGVIEKTTELRLNDDAIKQIQFDFVPNHNHHEVELKTSPMKKSWMDFQVDLSVPKNMIDTAKVRKPQKYIRMLPYSIWSLFGKDPTYDVLVFGTKKRLESMSKLSLDKVEEYGRSLIPNAGRYNPNKTTGTANVVIGDLDFIGFLYNNLNKQGRIRKHNRKHAVAWKTYNKVAPVLSHDLSVELDTLNKSDDYYSEALPGLYHNSKSIELIEQKTPKYFERPDHRLLQTSEQRSRFGTFDDPDLYALPSEKRKQNVDSLRSTLPSKEVKRKRRKARKSKMVKKHLNDDVLDELPNSMDELYKYIRAKQYQDSLQRKEIFRKDKSEQNVYELEQQQRKLRERQS